MVLKWLFRVWRKRSAIRHKHRVQVVSMVFLLMLYDFFLRTLLTSREKRRRNDKKNVQEKERTKISISWIEITRKRQYYWCWFWRRRREKNWTSRKKRGWYTRSVSRTIPKKRIWKRSQRHPIRMQRQSRGGNCTDDQKRKWEEKDIISWDDKKLLKTETNTALMTLTFKRKWSTDITNALIIENCGLTRSFCSSVKKSSQSKDDCSFILLDDFDTKHEGHREG